MSMEDLDPNELHLCRIGSIDEDNDVEWEEVASLKFDVIQDRRGQDIESILVLNENDRPCYRFHESDVQEKGVLRSSNWIVKILKFQMEDLMDLIDFCEDTEELQKLRDRVEYPKDTDYPIERLFDKRERILELEEKDPSECACESCGCDNKDGKG